MRWLLLIPAVYVAAVLQTTLVGALALGRVEPDLLALVALTWTLRAAGPYGFVTAGAVGLLADLVAPGRVGPGPACYAAVGYAVLGLRTRLPLGALTGEITMIGLGTAAIAWAQLVARTLLGEPVGPLRTGLLAGSGVGLYTAAVSLPVLVALDRLKPKEP